MIYISKYNILKILDAFSLKVFILTCSFLLLAVIACNRTKTLQEVLILPGFAMSCPTSTSVVLIGASYKLLQKGMKKVTCNCMLVCPVDINIKEGNLM